MNRTPPDPGQIADVYIDESSQTKHTYLVLGGIIVPATVREAFIDALAQARLPEIPRGEAKWVKVSRSKLSAYRRMVDFFFEHDAARQCHFHSLVVDTRNFDHGSYNQGSREIGFNKEVFQLASKFARLYPYLFHVYPDHRETNQLPEDLRLILNRARAQKGDQRKWPFRRCQFRQSEQCLPIQLTDILIGSLAYKLNGHDVAENASPSKIELSEYIRDRARIRDVFRDTAIRGKFTVWHRQLRPRVPRP